MRIALFLGHPAHFHMLKHAAANLKRDGHEVFFVIKKKDILENLCKEAGYTYSKIRENRSNTKWGLIKSVLGMEWHMLRFIHRNKIEMLVGSTLAFAAAKLARIPVIAMGEDDAEIVPRYAKMVYPFASAVFSPMACNNGQWEHKSIKYPGFQKLTYLHPHWFKADKEIARRNGINPDEPYFLIRFAKLNAHHDSGVNGISTDVARRLVEILAPHGKIYITSERKLEPEFEQYGLHINPLDIHHVMAFATLYIGDSQSMANEAAMLGVPSLRFNDFVGAKKIGVMEELEKVYGLTYGISSKEPEKLYAKVEELLGMKDLRGTFQERREKMLSEKIDVTAFLTYFIENYPQSAAEARNADRSFWKRFK